jgi:hypothetical protein
MTTHPKLLFPHSVSHQWAATRARLGNPALTVLRRLGRIGWPRRGAAMPMPMPRPMLGLILALALPTLALAQPTVSACQARSAVHQLQLVELYTSEGCNSCPPADRWLSGLKARSDVLAAAFHVDYWDRLGWVDRFGSARHTARQAEQQGHSGAGFSYTPQVLVNGRDWRGWPALPLLDRPASVQITLLRLDGHQVSVDVVAQRGAPPRLAMWWAMLEDQHSSTVAAGENHGATLRHDHVVRQYTPVAAWGSADSPSRSIRVDASRNGEAGHKARLLVVVVDAATGAPLQAVQLDC